MSQNPFPPVSSFRLSRKDWREFYETKRTGIFWFLVPVFCVGMAAGIWEDQIDAFTNRFFPPSYTGWILLIVLVALGLLLWKIILKLRFLILSLLVKLGRGEIKARGEIKGLIYDWDGKSISYNWEDLAIIETNNLIGFVRDKNNQYLVPKSAFEGLSQARKFTMLAHELGNDEFLSADDLEKEKIIARLSIQPRFDVEFRLSGEDYEKIGPPIANFNLKWAAVSLICAAIAGFSSANLNFVFNLRALYFVIGALVIAIILLAFGALLREKYFETGFQKQRFEPFNIIVRQDSVTIYLGQYSFGTYDYASIKLERHQDFLFLCDFKNQKFYVPARAFETLEDFKEFGDYLEAKISNIRP